MPRRAVAYLGANCAEVSCVRSRSAAPVRRFALVVGLLLLVASCARASAREEPIRIGVNLWVGYDLLAVAEERGLFADHGVEIEIVDFTSLSDVVAAYGRGHIDGMATSVNEVLQVRSEGARSPQIFLITDYSAGADVIGAAPGIESVADLAGRRVLVEPPLGSFILALALRPSGLSLEDVEVVLANQVEMPSVVAAGGADAAVGFPPSRSNWSATTASPRSSRLQRPPARSSML